MNINPKEKSQVTITGIIDGVYRARQQLIVRTMFILLILTKNSLGTTKSFVVHCKLSSVVFRVTVSLTFVFIFEQGNLPVALIFDYPENSVKQEDLNTLMNQFGVFIAARHKQRQSTLCIVIKGIEKYVGNNLNKIISVIET